MFLVGGQNELAGFYILAASAHLACSHSTSVDASVWILSSTRLFAQKQDKQSIYVSSFVYTIDCDSMQC